MKEILRTQKVTNAHRNDRRPYSTQLYNFVWLWSLYHKAIKVSSVFCKFAAFVSMGKVRLCLKCGAHAPGSLGSPSRKQGSGWRVRWCVDWPHPSNLRERRSICPTPLTRGAPLLSHARHFPRLAGESPRSGRLTVEIAPWGKAIVVQNKSL